MKTLRRFRPGLEACESRCLLSTAVLDITNQSTYTVTFNFRWNSSSTWTKVVEAPNQGYYWYTTYTSSLSPQVMFNPTPGSSYQKIYTLGYNTYNGSGTPPSSSAKVYSFNNTPTGIDLYAGSGGSTPTTPTTPPSGLAVAY